MDLPKHEWFICPECGGPTYVIWDHNQTTRPVDCIHCRRTLHDERIVVNEKEPDHPDAITVRYNDGTTKRGTPVLSKRRLGEDGLPVKVTVGDPRQVGCTYEATRGKGLDEKRAWLEHGRHREGTIPSDAEAQFGKRI